MTTAGFEPATYDAAKAETVLEAINATHKISPPGLGEMAFDPKKDLVFDYGPALPGHANGLILRGRDGQGDVITEVTYYSIGGGFVGPPNAETSFPRVFLVDHVRVYQRP